MKLYTQSTCDQTGLQLELLTTLLWIHHQLQLCHHFIELHLLFIKNSFFEEEETTHDLAPLPDGRFLKKLRSFYTEIVPAYLPSTVNPTCIVKADQIPDLKTNTNVEM